MPKSKSGEQKAALIPTAPASELSVKDIPPLCGQQAPKIVRLLLSPVNVAELQIDGRRVNRFQPL
jgi:hypothetical protein